MPVSRKVLIRVVGAPLLLGLLGLLLWMDYRTGRNLGIRWLLVPVGVLCAYEFYMLCRARGIETAWIVGMAATGAFLAPWPSLAQALGASPASRMDFVLWRLSIPTSFLLYALLKLVFRHGRFTVEGAALSALGFAYPALLGLAIPPGFEGRTAWWFIVFLVAANKVSDMAAYVTGKTLGRRKMTPALSPNKTWEGALGGAVAGTAAGAAVLLASPLRTAFPGIGVVPLLSLALLVTIASQVGDLAESAFKRWAGVKDSGRLLPEFGGMLDMADSFLVSIPVAHLLALVLKSY